jgi:GT2 family glycosyltransferase
MRQTGGAGAGTDAVKAASRTNTAERGGTVSVVIPCYKYGHFLEKAVASVLDDQAGVDVRVLIIDDASPDDSAEVARRIAAQDPRVETIVHAENKGNIATYNEGLLEWADGDYCALLSADDRLTPGALRRARDFLDSHPTAGFVYGRALWVVDGDPDPAPRTTPRSASIWPGQWWLGRRFKDGENPITSPEVVMRTSVLKRVGAFDPLLPHAGDMELWMRLAANADVGFLRGVDQAFYRLHQTNMRKGFDVLRDLEERRRVFKTVLDRDGDSLPERDQLCHAAHASLGREALWAAGRIRLRGDADQQSQVNALLGFATDCSPGLRQHPAYVAVASEGHLGPRALAFLAAHKLQWWLRRRGWKYRGY